MPDIVYSDPIVKNGHFTWHEYALEREWNKLLVPDTPQKDRAIFLFTHVEKLIRVPLNEEIFVHSGARSKEYTRYLIKKGYKAAMNGAHITWGAVDLGAPKTMTNRQFWNYCDKVWPGRMEILERTPTWVHLDIRNWGKRERFIPF